MASTTIAEQVKEFLEAVWTKTEKNPWLYVKAVGTKLVEFIDFSEKLFRAFGKRLTAVEQQQAAIMEALGGGTAPTAEAGSNGNGSNGNGHAAPPPRRGGGIGHDMVRVDALMQPLSPEEQAAEEAADMQFNGAIDESRYMPRGFTPPGNGQPTAPPPSVEPPAAPSAPAPSALVPVKPQAQQS